MFLLCFLSKMVKFFISMQNFNAEINHVQKKIYYIIIKDKYIFLQFAIHATRVF